MTRRYDIIPGELPDGHRVAWTDHTGTPFNGRPVSNGHSHNAGPPPEIQIHNAGHDPEPSDIEPREWLMAPMFCCQFISGLIGEGAVGKSSLRILQLISLAIGRPLSGHKVFLPCNVLIVSLEDSRKELQRRIAAARIHHKVSKQELDGFLFYVTVEDLKRMKLAVMGPNGPEKGQLPAALERIVKKHDIAIISIDPTIKAHELNENLNKDMDFVCDILSEMAIRLNIAIDLPMHARKGPKEAGDSDNARGASSVRDAGRLLYTLSRMSPEEADAFDIKRDERRKYVRLDSAKVNIASGTEAAAWFQLVGVRLGNGTETYPNGDEVQTVEVWAPPQTWADLSSATLNAALDDIEKGLIGDEGLPTGQRYTAASRATDRAAWRIVQRYCDGKTETQCREIVNTWVRNGVLKEDKYDDPVERKKLVGLYVVTAKRPGLEVRD
jgi:hypothetical protein